MIRRKALRALAVLTFGLFVPKTTATKSQSHKAEIEPETVVCFIHRKGKTYALGFEITDDKEENAKMVLALNRALGMTLWTQLDLVPDPYRDRF